MPLTLQRVAVVLQNQPRADALDQVGPLISQFLGPPANLSLSQACGFQCIAVLDWIWSCSATSEAPRSDDAWSLANFLRCDEFYHRWQFAEAAKVAVKLNDLVMLKWLFDHFKEGTVPSGVVDIAAEKGNMSLLKFLLANDSKDSSKVQWGHGPVQTALQSNQLDVAHWLYKNTPQEGTTEEQHEWTIKAAMDAGDLAFCQSILPKGSCILDYAEYCDTPQVIEWKLDCGYLKRDSYGAAVAIRDLASTDQLDLIKRIAAEYNAPPNDVDWTTEWSDALKEACEAGRFSVVKWLVEHPSGRRAIEVMRRNRTLSKLLSYPASQGNIEVMQFLYEQNAVSKFGNTLVCAIRENQMEAVKWLLEHFPKTEKVPDYCVMDEAARRGRLEMLQFFQSLGSAGVPGFFPAEEPTTQNEEAGKGVEVNPPGMIVEDADRCRFIIKVDRYRQTWAPTDAMDDAAANGHLETVKWLHQFRQEGCTSAAMDSAAANGHLEVVKWLYSNRNEGCTSDALDFAAANGHLDIVQWLHQNTTAGCTSNAMDLAATGGHLDTLKWLRENRGEDCTVAAIGKAVSNGHLDVACWLRRHYPEFTPVYISLPSSPTKIFDVLLFLHTHYANTFTPAFAQTAHAFVSQTFVGWPDFPVLGWLKHNYPAPNTLEGQRDPRLDGIAGRIFAGIAQQIAGQLGGVVHVVPPGQALPGQHGHGRPLMAMGMDNITMIIDTGDEGDVGDAEDGA